MSMKKRDLIEAFKDGDRDVRLAAASALHRIGEPALPQIIEALKKNEHRTRYKLITALGNIGPPAAEPPGRMMRVFIDSVHSVNLRAMPKTAVTHIQKRAPGPP